MKSEIKKTTIFLFLFLLTFTSNCVGSVKKSVWDPKSILGFILSIDPFKLNPPPVSKITMLGAVNTIQEGESATMGILLENNPHKQIVVTCKTDFPSLLINGSSQAEFTFSSANFSIEQTISLSTVIDPDNISDKATLKCTATGLNEVVTNILVSDDSGIILTGTVPTLLEGDSVNIGVRLSKQPTTNVTVLVNRNNSAVTINTLTTLSLTFTPANYNTSQSVTIFAVIDGNSTNDPTTLTFSLTGIPDVTYNLTVIDDNVIQLTGPPTSITEGLSTPMGIRFFKPLLTNNSITITSSNPAAITVDGGASATFNYTPGNATTDQNVTLAALLDVNLVSETVSLTLTAVGMAPLVIIVTTVDTDTQNLVITGAIPTLVENTNGIIQVQLTNMPPTPVTVNIITSNGTSLGVVPSTLTFTPGNYNVNQSVTVSALDEANETSEYLTVVFTSPSAPMQVYNVTTIDDDTRILLSGATSVNEGGSSVVTVSLSGDPGIARTINLTSGDPLAMSLGTAALTFSPGNYTQSITIGGVQDANIINETVLLTGSAAGLITATANITTVDNDTLNILFSTGSNFISEGATSTLNLSLSQEPSPSLTVTLASSIVGSISLAPASFTFNNVCPGPNCWSTNQTITATGVEDANETSETAVITASAAAVTNVSLNITTIENDTKPVFAGPATVTEGGAALITVALSGDPGASRTVSLASSNTLAITLNPATLSFNTTNWNIPQSVLLSGIPDSNIVAEAVTITGSGVGLVTDTTIVNTVDINTMSILLSSNPTTIAEGGVATFNVKLAQEPSPSLVVSLASGTVGSVSLGTGSITFDNVCPGAQCWSTNQTINMAGVEDVNETSETVAITATAPATPNATFNIDTIENDAKAVFTGAVTVNESGTAVLSVQLSGNPNGARTLNLVSSNTLAITLSPATLSFNSSNWNIPQSVTMTGVVDANTSVETVTLTGSGVDLGGATVNVTTVDNTVNNIILTAASTTVSEGGTTTLDVKLSAEPSPSTTVTLASSNVGSVSFAPATLTFDNVCPGVNCWSTNKTVTLTGVEEANETSEAVTISATAPSITSASAVFDTIENDTKPVFTGSVSVTEGSTSLISVALSGNPGIARTVTIASSNTLAITLSPATLSFNAFNWNVPQAVLLTGVVDANTASEAITITGSGVGLVSDTHIVNTIDSSIMSIILTPSALTVGEGGTSTFDAKLSNEPSPSLTVSFASSIVGSVTVAPATFIFNNVCPGANCWSTNQTITLTGVEDLNETSETVVITATAPATTSSTFNIDTADNDAKPIFTGATSVNEGGTALISVALSGNPGATRTLNLVSSNTLSITLLPATLIFNSSNWNVPQSVLLSGVTDANAVAESVTITGSGVDLGTDTTTITTVDVNTMNIVLTAGATTVSEGASSSFSAKLSQEPSPSLVVSFASSNTGAVTVAPASVTFDNVCPGANCWSSLKTITLNGVEDVNETTETVVITASAPAVPNATLSIDTVENDTKPVFSGVVTVTEGGTVLLSVALSGNPGAGRTVNLVSSAPAAITLTPASLVFNASNWNIPQAVLLSGIPDANTVSEAVTITGSGIDLGNATIVINTVDTNTMSLVLSAPSTIVDEGSSSSFNISLSQEPSPSLVVSFASGNVSAVTVALASVTFDNVCPGANCWSVPKTITVNGIEDVNETTETVVITASAPAVSNATINFATTDNDSKPVFTGPITVNEGGTALISVALSGNPGTARTLNLVSSNTLAMTLSPASLSFNAANWNVPQSVLLNGLSDSNTASESVTITGSGTDLGTDTRIISTVDTSLMNIILTAGASTISEGSTLPMNVKLSNEPSPSLTVTLATTNAGSVSLGTTTLTFNNVCPGAQCWSTDQVVTLTGVEDANQASEAVTISASAPSATGASLNFTTIENDTSVVIGGAVSVTEGGTAYITITLTGDPGIDRIIALASSDSSALTIFPPTLTFNPANWNTPQTVEVTGVSDVNTIGEVVTITGSGAGIVSGTGTVNTVDINTFDLVVVNDSGTTNVNEGSSLSFSVKLNYEPVASPYTVTISAPLTSAIVPGYVLTPTYVIDPANSGIGSTTLTFTTANYATPQAVTINAPENFYVDNKISVLSFSGAGVTTKNYSITVVDNDPVETMLVDDGMGPACNDVSSSYDGVKMLVAAQCSNGGTFNRVKAFRCESNFSYCLDMNTATLDSGGDNNARSLTALYHTGQAMIVSENKSNGKMNFFTGPLGSWSYYDMSDVPKFNLANNTAISSRAAWDSTNSKVIVAASYGAGIYLYSYDKFGNNLNTPVNIPAATVDPGIMIETVTDTTNSKVTVTFQYQPSVVGQYELAFVQCNLDLTGCTAPATISSLVGLMADGLPLWIKHSQGLYDATTNKFYLITSMGNTEGGSDTIPKLIICNPNMTGCTAQTIHTGHRSALKTKIAVDNFNNKLLILAYDSTQSYSVVLNRCSLAGTACTRKNLTGSFGSNIGSNMANPFIDTANKKLRFIGINNASGGVLSMYSMLVYID